MSRAIGNIFEAQACQLVKQAGLRIVVTNYHVPKVGEIDIIAYQADILALVAIEVRSKKRRDYGVATQSVTRAKQIKIINTMMHFLQDESYNDYANAFVRFDVIGFDDG